MKHFKLIGISFLVVLTVAGIWLYPKANMLYQTVHLFDEDRIVENFRSADQIWPSRKLKQSTNPMAMPTGTEISLPESFTYLDNQYTAEEYLKDSRTTGLLVIQNDSVVYEQYYLGNSESTRNISWSMAKSFVSALIGIAVDQGHIQNVMQDVDEYCPELKGSGYEGVTIKDVLQMSTGVAFNEDYGDYDSDINRWGRGFALGESQDEFAASLKREIAPGTVNHYVSINTHVLGMVLTAATGKTVTEFMQEYLWEPMGMEHDAYWMIDGEGMEMVLGGLNATLRDYAKIGTLFMHEGEMNGQQIVPKEWVRVSTQADAPHLQPGQSGYFGYGYQWWIPPGNDREFMALGVYNQNIYINPSTKTVIAKLSANHLYNDPNFLPSHDEMGLELYRSIADKFRAAKEVKEQALVTIDK